MAGVQIGRDLRIFFQKNWDFAIREYNQITPSGHDVQNFFYKQYTWIYSLIKNLECDKEIIWLLTYDGNEAWKIFSGPILLLYENLVL